MKTFAFLGAVNAFLAVAAGAFGAHGLKQRLDADALAVYEVAARYHMYHALGLFVIAWLVARQAPYATAAGWCMFGGIVVFSGSLYLLSTTGTKWLGAVTPIGGLGFLLGWGLAAYAVLKSPA